MNVEESIQEIDDYVSEGVGYKFYREAFAKFETEILKYTHPIYSKNPKFGHELYGSSVAVYHEGGAHLATAHHLIESILRQEGTPVVFLNGQERELDLDEMIVLCDNMVDYDVCLVPVGELAEFVCRGDIYKSDRFFGVSKQCLIGYPLARNSPYKTGGTANGNVATGYLTSLVKVDNESLDPKLPNVSSSTHFFFSHLAGLYAKNSSEPPIVARRNNLPSLKGLSG